MDHLTIVVQYLKVTKIFDGATPTNFQPIPQKSQLQSKVYQVDVLVNGMNLSII